MSTPAIHQAVRGFILRAASETPGAGNFEGGRLPLSYVQTAQAYAFLFPGYGTEEQARQSLTNVLHGGDQIGLGDADETARVLVLNNRLPLLPGLDLKASAERWAVSLEQSARQVAGALGEPVALERRTAAPSGALVAGALVAGFGLLFVLIRRKS